MAIYTTGQHVPDAYHGTTPECWTSIQEVGFQDQGVQTPAAYHRKWFGSGVYFYDGDAEFAKDWPHDTPVGTKLVVLKASIDLGKMLDLQTTLVQRALKRTHEGLIAANVPWQEISDAAVIDFVCHELKIDTVRGTGQIAPQYSDRIYPGSKLLKLKPLIICVKTLAMITNVCMFCYHHRK